MLLWSSTATLTVMGGQEMKNHLWQFICVTAMVSGLGQLVYYGARGQLRGCLVMPWRLWLLTLLFVTYGLVFPMALMMSRGQQIYEANLLNYAWPVLTVVLAVLWVPGTRMTPRLFVAIALAAGGLAIANWDPLWNLLTRGMVRDNPWPYVLAGMAGVLWAAYSALLSRWRSAASNYATAPIGFIIIGLISGAVCLAGHDWAPPGPMAWVAMLGLSFGPYGAGYLLWELALHRAPASVLGLMAASLPAMSTLLMGAIMQDGFKPYLLVAAGVVSASVVLGNLSGPKNNCQTASGR